MFTHRRLGDSAFAPQQTAAVLLQVIGRPQLVRGNRGFKTHGANNAEYLSIAVHPVSGYRWFFVVRFH